MQDRTINNALLALCVQMNREVRNGLEHVEGPLRLRRVPLPEVTRAPRRELAAMLREGPITCRQIADRVQKARGFTRRRARDTVVNTLAKMKRAEWVRLEGGL